MGLVFINCDCTLCQRLFSRPPIIRVHDKVMIPQEEHPDINFVGLLIGPRGNTLKGIHLSVSVAHYELYGTPPYVPISLHRGQQLFATGIIIPFLFISF